MEDIKDEKLALSEPTAKAGDAEVKEGSQMKNEIPSVTAIKKGKIRKRKKGLHTAIRNQMEFYFSDANISKDRFMQTVIKDGPGNESYHFISYVFRVNTHVFNTS